LLIVGIVVGGRERQWEIASSKRATRLDAIPGGIVGVR